MVAIIFGLFFAFEVILWILEVKGKIVLEGANIKRQIQKKKLKKQEQEKLLQDVKSLLNDVNLHYSEDNIKKRNEWMEWVNNRAEVYDASIIKISEDLAVATQALKENTKMTEDMFVETSRDRIIDFSEKASNYDCLLSREQFRRINRVYDDYERFLEERNRQNGEIDTAYEVIQDGYKYRLKHRSFLEDMRDNNR